MKKKLLSFMMAICLILPCAFMFSACGGEGGGGEGQIPTGLYTLAEKNMGESKYFVTADCKSGNIVDVNLRMSDGIYKNELLFRLELEQKDENFFTTKKLIQASTKEYVLNTLINETIISPSSVQKFYTLCFYYNKGHIVFLPASDGIPAFLMSNSKSEPLAADDFAYKGGFYKLLGYPYDVKVQRNSTLEDVKSRIAYIGFCVLGNSNNVPLFDSANDIVSVKYNGEDFDASENGTYDVVVTYDTDKTINLTILVESNLSKVVSVDFDNYSLKRIPLGSNLETFISEKNLKVKLSSELDEQAVSITTEMLSGIDTSKVGNYNASIEYKGYSSNFNVCVYDPENIKIEDLKTSSYGTELNIFEKGSSVTVDDFYIKASFDDGSSVRLAPETTGLTMENFDINTAGFQKVKVSYKGLVRYMAVYVYDETHNIAVDCTRDGYLNFVDGVMSDTINVKLADGNYSTPVAITQQMIDKPIEELENGEYVCINYEYEGYTFHAQIMCVFTTSQDE